MTTDLQQYRHHELPSMVAFSCLVFLCSCFLILEKTQGYLLGSNVSLSFNHELSDPDVSRTICSVFVSDRDQPLFVNEQTFASSFKPGQLERFGFHYDRIQRNFTVTFTISNLQVIDKGNYHVVINELVNGRVASDAKHPFIVTVTYPPGKANCELSSNIPDNDWQTIRCNSTAGNDGSGYLVCLQNLKRLPLRGDLSTDGTSIVAVYYWIHPKLPVRCCSIASSVAVPLDSCYDIVFYPPQDNFSSTIDQPAPTDYLSTSRPSPTDIIGDDGSNAHRGSFIAVTVLAILLGISLVFILVVLIDRKLKCFKRVKIYLMEMKRNW